MMKQRSRCLLILIITLAMLGMLPAFAFADGLNLYTASDVVPGSACAVLYKNGDLVLQRTTKPDGGKGHADADVSKKFDSLYSEFEEDGEIYIAPSWIESRDDIKAVSVRGNVSVGRLRNLFSECMNLRDVDLAGLDTSRVTDASDMFHKNFMLESIDLSVLDLSSVTTMNGMFADCCYLQAVNLSGIDTTDVDTDWMFANCQALSTLVIGPEARFSEECFLPDGSWTQKGTGKVMSSTRGFIAATGHSDMAGEWRFKSSQAHIDKGAYAILYSNGDFVIQNTAKPDGAPDHYASNVVETYEKIGRFIHNEDGSYVKPWFSRKDEIRRVIVADRVVVGGYAGASSMFKGCKNLVSADLSNLVSRESCSVFAGCSSLSVLVLGRDLTLENDCHLLEGAWTSYTDGASFKATSKFLAAFNKRPMPGIWVRSGVPISIAFAKVRIPPQKYTGSALRPRPTVKLGKQKLVVDKDFTVTYKCNKNAGNAIAIVKGRGLYGDTAKRLFVIAKAANPMKVVGERVVIRYSKSKNLQVSAALAYTFAKKSVGEIEYRQIKKGSSRHLKVNSKSGSITVLKGTPRKMHIIRVAVDAKGDKNHKLASRIVSVKVRVR